MSFDDKQLTVFQDLMSCVVAPKTLTSVHYHSVQLTFRLSDFYKL